MIQAIITDLDGTLVDTYEANLLAYKEAFSDVGLELSSDTYRACFGLRYDEFMCAIGVGDLETYAKIKDLKKKHYPKYFEYLNPNTALIELIKTYRILGLKTAIASTARRENLVNVVEYLDIKDMFDIIYTGEHVTEGKPSPEIYKKAMEELNVKPENVIIFEDSVVGLEAAKSSGAHVIKIIL